MKTGQVVALSVVAVVGLVIAFEIGLHLRTLPSPRNPNARVITISASTKDASKCEEDYPVAVLHFNQNQSVQWQSLDKKYWISFVTIGPQPGENPLAPNDDPVSVDANGGSKTYHVKPNEKYYMYAIFDHDPATNNQNPCKTATDDHDPGLNVKP